MQNRAEEMNVLVYFCIFDAMVYQRHTLLIQDIISNQDKIQFK